MKIERKPSWLKINLQTNAQFAATRRIVEKHNLHTICTSGRCPNQAECWSKGTATFMIAGEICTRSCKFCNTKTGRPLPINPDEATYVAESVKLMSLRHAVITSVDRDDLNDLGAQHWANTIKAIRRSSPSTIIEVLIPDFQGNQSLCDVVLEAQPDIIGHNLETVQRLTPSVRSAAKYETSLAVLSYLSNKGARTKSGIMVGLGETIDEVLEAIADLYNSGCRLLTIGQYLQPSKENLPVVEYITPEQFDKYREEALRIGFTHVASAPLVRSSYYAEELVLEEKQVSGCSSQNTPRD